MLGMLFQAFFAGLGLIFVLIWKVFKIFLIPILIIFVFCLIKFLLQTYGSKAIAAVKAKAKDNKKHHSS